MGFVETEELFLGIPSFRGGPVPESGGGGDVWGVIGTRSGGDGGRLASVPVLRRVCRDGRTAEGLCCSVHAGTSPGGVVVSWRDGWVAGGLLNWRTRES